MFFFVLLPIIVSGLIVSSTSLDKATPDKSNVNTLPTIYDHLFIATAKTYGLDWKMLKRIAYNESTLGKNPRVAIGLRDPANIKDSVSTDGKSWGLMQFTLTTARDFDKTATEKKLNDPAYSIDLAGRYFAFLKRSYPTFTERDLVMSYNHGQGNQLNFIKKEKAGTLLVTEYPAGRAYWKKYQTAKELIA